VKNITKKVDDAVQHATMGEDRNRIISPYTCKIVTLLFAVVDITHSFSCLASCHVLNHSNFDCCAHFDMLPLSE
jgi:hypothetical protein